MELLFHQDVVVATLASGSRGNCTYVGTPTRGLLVDCGLSTKQVLRRMQEIGLGAARIEGVLITHEHADHVGAARVLSKRLAKDQPEHPVPFCMTRGTMRGIHPNAVPTGIQHVVAGERFQLGRFEVAPFRVPHDVSDPVAYRISHQGVNVCVLTDLGRTTRLVGRMLHECDVAVVEFNHDVEMLMEGSYPWPLKQRVRGGHGHLSNDQASALIASAASARLKHLVLAHLSEENNLPERALEASHQGLHEAGLRGVQVSVASQQLPLGPMRVAMPSAYRPPKPSPRRRSAARPSATVPVMAARQLSLFG